MTKFYLFDSIHTHASIAINCLKKYWENCTN